MSEPTTQDMMMDTGVIAASDSLIKKHLEALLEGPAVIHVVDINGFRSRYDKEGPGFRDKVVNIIWDYLKSLRDMKRIEYRQRLDYDTFLVVSSDNVASCLKRNLDTMLEPMMLTTRIGYSDYSDNVGSALEEAKSNCSKARGEQSNIYPPVK